jgi:hypothetical protein
MRGEVTSTQVGEPLRHGAGFMVAKKLMDTAATHARYRGDVADGEAGIMGSNDGPPALTFSFCLMISLSRILDALVYVCSRVLSRSLCAQVLARSYREGAS